MSLRPEEELLLHCCAFGNSQRRTEIPRLTSGPIDWSYFLRIATWHCVMPHAYRVLRDGFSELLPRDALAAMGREFAQNALRNRLLTAELVKLMGRLEEHGVEALTLKGPTLALAAHGDIALRQFGDLDILVSERAFPAVVEVLETEGYRPRRFRKGKKRSERFFDLEDEFMKPGSIALLDVHRTLLPRFLGSFPCYDELLRSSVTINLIGTDVRTLAPAELLLFLCVHGAKHGWKLLSWVCDIAGLLRSDRGQIDWNYVSDLASRFGYRRALSLGLLLAEDMLYAAVPEDSVCAARDDGVVRSLAAGISARMFRGIEQRPTLYQDWFVPLRLMEAPAARARYLVRRALTPAVQDRELFDFGCLYPLYWLVRPLRLLCEQGPRLLGKAVKADTIPSASRYYED